jgi:hypothetical protein
MLDPALKDGLAKAKAEQAQIDAKMMEIDAIPVVTLPPGIAESYRTQVRDLAKALSQHQSTPWRTPGKSGRYPQNTPQSYPHLGVSVHERGRTPVTYRVRNMADFWGLSRRRRTVMVWKMERVERVSLKHTYS